MCGGAPDIVLPDPKRAVRDPFRFNLKRRKAAQVAARRGSRYLPQQMNDMLIGRQNIPNQEPAPARNAVTGRAVNAAAISKGVA